MAWAVLILPLPNRDPSRASSIAILCLEAISQMPQQNNASTKAEHPEKISCIAFVAHDHW